MDISKEPIAQATKDSVAANQNLNEGKRIQANQLFATSKYEIASALKKTISELYNKLKVIREHVTADFLRSSTEDELAEKRSQISGLYSDFITKYSQIQSENLTNEESHELITQKVDAETATNNVDKFIQNELKSREEAKSNSQVKPKSGESQLPGTSSDVASKHSEQIRILQDQLQSMILQAQSEKNDADERIKSLENKISNSNQQYDEMVGDPFGQSEPQEVEQSGPLVTIFNQGMTGPRIGQITIPAFTGNLEDWESFKALYEALIHSSTKNKTVKFNQLRTLLKGQALKGTP